jgi:hypothetical protein
MRAAQWWSDEDLQQPVFWKAENKSKQKLSELAKD